MPRVKTEDITDTELEYQFMMAKFNNIKSKFVEFKIWIHKTKSSSEYMTQKVNIITTSWKKLLLRKELKSKMNFAKKLSELQTHTED